MQSRQQAIQCKDEFIQAWVGKVHEEISQLFMAIIEKAKKENVFDINMTTAYGSGLLHLIVVTGQDQTKAIDILLANGADINLAEAGTGNRTPLHLAIAKFSMNNDKYNFVDFLILKGADVNKGDKEGKTPLHIVVMLIDYSGANHSRSLLLPLLEKGALVANQDNDGSNAYEYLEDKIEDKTKDKIEENPAAYEIEELKECMHILEEYFKKEKELATQHAIEFEQKFKEKWKDKQKPYSGFLLPKIMKRAKEDGIFDINWDGESFGVTLLHFAAALHEHEVIQLLLEYGADANIQATQSRNYVRIGYTPLHCVCDPNRFGFKDWKSETIREDVRHCILILSKHDAKLDIPDEEGYTVLNIAIANRQHDNGAFYNLLIEGRSNPYEKSKLIALTTGTYQVASLFEICLFKAKKSIPKTTIENKKDQMPVEIYSRLVS